MTEKRAPGKRRAAMKPLPVRRSAAERAVIKRLAKSANLSEARLMVTAALMMNEFRTGDELRAAVHLGGQLWQSRTLAVMQVRRVGRQLERLRDEGAAQAGVAHSVRLEEVLGDVAAVLRNLGARWGSGRSQR